MSLLRLKIYLRRSHFHDGKLCSYKKPVKSYQENRKQNIEYHMSKQKGLHQNSPKIANNQNIRSESVFKFLYLGLGFDLAERKRFLIEV